MDRRFQPQPLHLGDVAGLIRARQHHDALPMPGGAQAQAIAQRGHRERLGIRIERARHAFQPMAVGIRLDHGHHPGRRRQLLDARQVVAQCAEVDGGDGGAAHGSMRGTGSGKRGT